MARSRLTVEALGLCALVLGLMGLAGGTAQAEVGAHWNIIKANGELVQVNETNKLFAQWEILSITIIFLFTTKAGTKVGISCTGGKFDEGGRLQANGGISLGRILLTGCITTLNGSVSSSCKPKTAGKALGELLFEKFKGLIVLDEVGGVKEDYVKFVPDEGNTFMKIELGSECAIGEVVKMEAKAAGEGLWLKDSQGNTSFQEEKINHSFEESLHGLIMLGQPLVIDIEIELSLTGEHLGLKWGGTPG